MNAMRAVIAAFLVCTYLTGCIPLMVGGVIGYEMAKNDAHRDWCATHPVDGSCHP